MRSVVKALFAVLAISISGTAWADNPGNGAKIVLSQSGGPGTRISVTELRFRRADGTQDFSADYYQDAWIPHSTPDFASEQEKGIVEVHDLAPGDWVIYRVSVGEIRPVNDFAIPFSIKQGEAVYLGDFQIRHISGANEIPDDKFGHDVFAVDFKISDQSQRDIALAKAKDKTLDAVRVNVLQVPKDLSYFILPF